MKNFVVIGSCLSGSIAKELVKMGFNLIKAVDHQRVDNICAYLAGDNCFGASKAWIEKFLTEHEPAEDKAGRRFRHRMLVQTDENLSALRDAIAKADFLLYDTNYDLSSNLFEFNDESNPIRFCNLNKHLDKFKSLGLLNFDTAPCCYEEFLHQLMLINPQLNPIIIQYSTTAFEQTQQHTSRVARANKIASLLAPMAGKSLPLIDVPSNELSEKGLHYFSDGVYAIYAQAIARSITGKEGFPFRPDLRISLAELQSYAEQSDQTLIPHNNQRAHPYMHLPNRQFWKSAVGTQYPLDIRELYDKKFSIAPSDGIVTCGSCFAQHIGSRLKNHGFNFLDYEPAPPHLPKNAHTANGYGIYSARYGNVYTPVQLVQLLERALGERTFDEAWEVRDAGGHLCGFVDPFRPNLSLTHPT